MHRIEKGVCVSWAGREKGRVEVEADRIHPLPSVSLKGWETSPRPFILGVEGVILQGETALQLALHQLPPRILVKSEMYLKLGL